MNAAKNTICLLEKNTLENKFYPFFRASPRRSRENKILLPGQKYKIYLINRQWPKLLEKLAID